MNFRAGLLAFTFAFAFPALAQVTVNEQTDKIEALKIDLEQAKQMRDKVIAKRWEDRQRDNEAREKFNQEYDDLKNKLELKTQESDRLHSEIQNLLRDAEEAEAQAESERVQFLSLASNLRDKARELSEPLGKSFPARIPERLQRLNQVLKNAEIRREAPGEILADLGAFERGELGLSREIALERRGFTRADKTPGEGLLLRLGTVTSAYRDAKSGRVGLLLKNAPGASFTAFDWREDLPLPVTQSLDQAMLALDQESAAAITVPVDVLLTQNAVKSYTRESDKSFGVRLLTAVKTGGVFMWPLLIIPFLVIGLFIRKLMQLWRGRKVLVPSMVKAVSEMKPELGRERGEQTVRELMLMEVPRLERHLTTLAVFAAAAPLLGLLGTVSGLIAMFQVITEHGVNDPKLLAGGIGEALIATETGLLIAIPTLIGHNYLANRVDELVAAAEYHAMKALNAMWPAG